MVFRPALFRPFGPPKSVVATRILDDYGDYHGRSVGQEIVAVAKNDGRDDNRRAEECRQRGGGSNFETTTKNTD
jgi:hypothetical protein